MKHNRNYHDSANRYGDFRQVKRTGNWYASNLYDLTCTVFLGKFGKWGIILDDVLQGDWFDDPRDAMNHAVALAVDQILDEPGPEVHIPDAVKFFGLDIPFTEADLKDRYRKVALANHPDRGGSHEKMTLANRMFEEAMQWA